MAVDSSINTLIVLVHWINGNLSLWIRWINNTAWLYWQNL